MTQSTATLSTGEIRELFRSSRTKLNVVHAGPSLQLLPTNLINSYSELKLYHPYLNNNLLTAQLLREMKDAMAVGWTMLSNILN